MADEKEDEIVIRRQEAAVEAGREHGLQHFHECPECGGKWVCGEEKTKCCGEILCPDCDEELYGDCDEDPSTEYHDSEIEAQRRGRRIWK